MRALLIMLIFALALPANAETHVGNADELNRAIRQAAAGDVIVIAPGEYDVSDIKIRSDLTLRGRGKAILYASNPVAKGLLNPLPGVSLTVENLTFRHARSPDRNGAGIRNDGRNLTIINCEFIENENGVLSTGDRDGVIAIRNSEFLRNGHGDGYSHGIYVLRASRVEITDSAFVATHIGHHVKSLADETIIENSRLDDADGRTSYAVDLSKGGRVRIAGNTIVQSAQAENNTIINYDTSRGGAAQALIITGNTIVNHRKDGRFLRNDTDLAPMISENRITNEGHGALNDPPSRAGK